MSGVYSDERHAAKEVIASAMEQGLCPSSTQLTHLRREGGKTWVTVMAEFGFKGKSVKKVRTGSAENRNHSRAARQACAHAIGNLSIPDRRQQSS